MTNPSCVRRRAATTATLFGLLSCLAGLASLTEVLPQEPQQAAERHGVAASYAGWDRHPALLVFAPLASSLSA